MSGAVLLALAAATLAAQVAANIVQSVLGERLRDDMAGTNSVETNLDPARGPGLASLCSRPRSIARRGASVNTVCWPPCCSPGSPP